MTLLILGLVAFLGIHLVPTFPDMRASLVARLGEGGFKGLFTVLSLVGFVLLVWGFGQARWSNADFQLWTPPAWTKHVAFLLMWPAFILLVAAYVPSRIRDRAKHPMLAAVKLWAFAHLLANGDMAGLILFGSFLAWAVWDRISVKRRGAMGPLGARHGGLTSDLIVVVAGTLLYAGMLLWGHQRLIGISLIG